MAARAQIRRLPDASRLERGAVRLLTRTGLDWTRKYSAIAAAVEALPARQAYLDGELCGVPPEGSVIAIVSLLTSAAKLSLVTLRAARSDAPGR